MLKYIVPLFFLLSLVYAGTVDEMLPFCDDTVPECHRFVSTIYGPEFTYMAGPKCDRLPCAASAIACTATCLYEFPVCNAPISCTQCIRALYSKCCNCVLPDSICSG